MYKINKQDSFSFSTNCSFFTFNKNSFMKIALLQIPLAWENPDKNRNYIDATIRQNCSSCDLVVLPEMFTTGFTMNAALLAEKFDGPTLNWLKDLAKEMNLAITGSFIVTEDQEYFNRLVFVHPDGKVDFYDKRHLFTLAKEEQIFTSGRDKLIVNYKGWKICPLICYDLRFPVFSRNSDSYDLLIYVASWPEVRVSAWDALLKARAIENMSYTVGVNRVGVDGNNYPYVGHSCAIDYLGNQLHSQTEVEEVIFADLNINEQLTARNKFGFLNDQDRYKILD